MRYTYFITLLTLCSLVAHSHAIHKKTQQSQPIKESKKDLMTNPPLVMIIMVKNEAHVIEKTIEPFLKAGVPCVVLDTGSTDDTIKKARSAFAKYNNTQSYIIEKPFVDFSTTRNYALEYAEKKFPNAGFFLMIDADWYVQQIPELIEFCVEHSNDPTEAFGIKVNYNNTEYYVKRLLKANKKVRFVRPIHESVLVSSSKRLPDNIHIKWNDSAQGYEKSKNRWNKDKEILLKEIKKNPTDLLNIFYLAQTYGDLKEYENAITWYKKILDFKENYDEEKLTACYRIARIYDYLNNWPMALHYYLYAYNLNPKRAESLVGIATHYLKTGEYAACYLFAKEACAIPYPADAYWKDKDAYLYQRYDILAAVAWPLGHYQEGEKALKAALEHNPKDAHLLKNLKVYQDHNKTKSSKK